MDGWSTPKKKKKKTKKKKPKNLKTKKKKKKIQVTITLDFQTNFPAIFRSGRNLMVSDQEFGIEINKISQSSLGRENGIVSQVFPLAIRNLQLGRKWVLIWAILGELAVYFYSPSHQKTALPLQQARVGFFLLFSLLLLVLQVK